MARRWPMNEMLLILSEPSDTHVETRSLNSWRDAVGG